MIGTRGPNRSAVTAKSGFLLTETLATFTISAFVLVGLVSVSSILLRAVDRSIAQVQNVDDLSRTLEAITRDVSGLARARFNGFEPQPYVFRGGPNSLFFAHREIGRDGLPETHVISLREILVGTGTRLVRADAVLSARATSFEALRFWPARDLATGSARLRFSYVAPLKPDGTRPSQQKSWPSGGLLPAAVLVEAIDPASGTKLLTSRIPIHANADIGCLDQAGSAAGDTALPATSPPAQTLPGSAFSPVVALSPPGAQPDEACSIQFTAAPGVRL